MRNTVAMVGRTIRTVYREITSQCGNALGVYIFKINLCVGRVKPRTRGARETTSDTHCGGLSCVRFSRRIHTRILLFCLVFLLSRPSRTAALRCIALRCIYLQWHSVHRRDVAASLTTLSLFR